MSAHDEDLQLLSDAAAVLRDLVNQNGQDDFEADPEGAETLAELDERVRANAADDGLPDQQIWKGLETLLPSLQFPNINNTSPLAVAARELERARTTLRHNIRQRREDAGRLELEQQRELVEAVAVAITALTERRDADAQWRSRFEQLACLLEAQVTAVQRGELNGEQGGRWPLITYVLTDSERAELGAEAVCPKAGEVAEQLRSFLHLSEQEQYFLAELLRHVRGDFTGARKQLRTLPDPQWRRSTSKEVSR